MPTEVSQAIAWALTQATPDGDPVTDTNAHWLVHYVREWFNANGVTYPEFAYADLAPLLP